MHFALRQLTLSSANENNVSITDSMAQLGSLVRKLPSANRRLLKNVLQFLARVAGEHDKNKMSVSNLGTV